MNVLSEGQSDRPSFVWRIATSVAFLSTLWSCASVFAGEHPLAYSFRRNGGGGVALIRIDDTTGRIVDDRVLFESEECNRPEKLRRDAERRQYVLTNETDKKAGPHVFIVSENAAAATKSMALPSIPDEVRLRFGQALVTCDGDWLVQIDLQFAKIVKQWDAGEIVDPPANGPQDILFFEDGDESDSGRSIVVLSFQKDSRKGKKKGSRIVAFRWPEMSVIADARLPRNRPDLHIRGNKKESGPGPEIVHISKNTNRIFATLDLYGAVAFGELDRFLRGEEVIWKYLSTSIDGSWGNAFPDRMSAFRYDDAEVAFVANSGTSGGTALFDLAKRSLVWRCASPAGLETPIYVPNQAKVYSVCSGKQKARARRETEKTFIPQQGLFVFDLSKQKSNAPCFTQVPTDKFMFRIARVGPAEKPWIVLAGGHGSPDTLMVFDPRAGRFVDDRPASGALMRFES